LLFYDYHVVIYSNFFLLDVGRMSCSRQSALAPWSAGQPAPDLDLFAEEDEEEEDRQLLLQCLPDQHEQEPQLQKQEDEEELIIEEFDD
jgi:hypothetical protein